MTGTAINVGAILAGSCIGVSIGSRLPEKMRDTVLHGLGLLTILVGLQMGLGTKNILVVMSAMLLGGLLGELLRISDLLDRMGAFLQSLMAAHRSSTFGEGFVTASLIFCVGPMAILGSIQDGLTGDYRLLTIKSVLDGFAAIAFSASLGWGVAVSALSILIYQGGITLFASAISHFLTDPMVVEMTATGGLIIMGIGIRLLNLREIRLANFLPALAIAPMIVMLIPKIEALL
jgi:uncharacterized protein